MRLPHVTNLEDVDVAVLGLPFDNGTSFRAGARFGPEAIRSASSLLRPYHPIHGVDLFERLSVIDGGDLPVRPGDTEGTLEVAAAALDRYVDAEVLSVTLGGDHTITLAELRSLSRPFGPLSLIHLDAHADVWDNYFGQRYFHGTTFRRAIEERLIDPESSIQAGLRGPAYDASDLGAPRDLGLTTWRIGDLREAGAEGFGELVRNTVGDRPVFVSFDVDVCDPAFCPGTGTPEVGGLSSSEALAFLRALAGINLVGCDVVEVSPPYDGAGTPTALLAANVAWELLALAAVGARA